MDEKEQPSPTVEKIVQGSPRTPELTKESPTVRDLINSNIVKRNAEDKRKTPAKKVRELLKENEVVHSQKFIWRILQLLGSGGFGDVYRVKKNDEKTDKQSYAMKTEVVEGDQRMLRLKVDVMVLTSCMTAKPERRKHFVDVVDKGKTEKFKFIVMNLVGPSLDDVRRKYLGTNFSRSTALQIALQTLESISDLHDLGFIHRDIKPQNFAVGMGALESTIYMLDFGIARQIFQKGTREMRIPRVQVKFLGTLRFASRACHKGVEQGRRDDLETWIYMIYDIFDVKHGLPWKRAQDRSKVVQYKQNFFEHKYDAPYTIVPKCFKKVLDYIKSLHYRDEPEYDLIRKFIVKIGRDYDINLEKPMDWEGWDGKRKRRQEESEVTSSDNRQAGSNDITSQTNPKN